MGPCGWAVRHLRGRATSDAASAAPSGSAGLCAEPGKHSGSGEEGAGEGVGAGPDKSGLNGG